MYIHIKTQLKISRPCRYGSLTFLRREKIAPDVRDPTHLPIVVKLL